ncbi:hypothetical protein GCM10011367_00390 [Marinicauda pacifica]|uniref:Uncharacterized protein n=1 Tax=Marinicauda pacifica TaxID=1133559 RepID=A0A4S2HD35_9PROT|nr:MULTISPECIES: hypothetical protein [Marinicauda]TGY93753.1 hypothetical protein E5162_00195 [Marinicauda pacifica]GGE30010.1 hypothetical protein GCM10011367_00390 [Marinicauda pacifica]
MMIFLASALAVTSLAAQPARAPAPGQSTLAWVNACQTEAASRTSANVREACACAAGLFAGTMTERQYEIFGRMAPHISSRSDIAGAIQQMTEQQGYTPEEIAGVGQTIASLETRIDRVCGVLE